MSQPILRKSCAASSPSVAANSRSPAAPESLQPPINQNPLEISIRHRSERKKKPERKKKNLSSTGNSWKTSNTSFPARNKSSDEDQHHQGNTTQDHRSGKRHILNTHHLRRFFRLYVQIAMAS